MTSKLKQAGNAFKKLTKSLIGPRPAIEIKFITNDETNLNSNLPDCDDGTDSNITGYIDVLPAYYPGDSISGTIDIILVEGMKEFEYEEIVVYLIGQIQCNQINKDFTFHSQKLSLAAGPSKLYSSTQFDFLFNKPNLNEHASFYGSIVKCRYCVRVEVRRPGINVLGSANIWNEHDIMVMHPINNCDNYPTTKKVTMNVGVDQCLHIKFYYDNINLDCNGCLTGQVNILSNTLKIHTMQIQLLRREIVSTGIHNQPEIVNTEIIGKFELMDGAPGSDEVIPIRLFLGRFKKIGPTNSNKFFNVRYYVNLGLVDRDGRRYFKTCELLLWRKKRNN